MVQTSESVGAGHPDKICDIISDSILDAALSQDPNARVAVETWVKDNTVGLIGELSTTATIDFENIIRSTLKRIGYTNADWGIDYATCDIINLIGQQSPEIAQGVDEFDNHEQGAGDQGTMWGYATKETPQYLPLSLVLSHKLVKALGESDATYLRPDCKSQIALNDNKTIHNIVLAAQHSPDISENKLKEELKSNIIDPICKDYITQDTQIFINGTGKFEIGGPKGDAGLTGRKIIVDTYGGIGRHGGGAFSGKDPSKVDRSAAYLARYIAKHLVAAGFGDQAEVQLSYCIGIAQPTSIKVNLVNGTISEKQAIKLIEKYFPLKPAQITQHFQLKQPKGWSYAQTAVYGHFSDNAYPWEKLDLVDSLANDNKDL